MTNEPARWALPQLLRAFQQGHRSHRGRVLRLIANLDDETLSTPPVSRVFRSTLHGRDGDMARRVGDLVSARGLTAYGPDLVALLCTQERRKLAITWLRRARLPFPKDALVGLTLDGRAPPAARIAALRLLRRRAALARSELLSLLPLLAEQRFHPELLPLLKPHADSGMVAMAVDANRRFGEGILRRRRREAGKPEEPGLLHRLLFFSPTPSSVGEFANQVARQQRPFIVAIAHLAIAAGSQDWLAALLPHLFDAGLTQPLRAAYIEHDVRRIGAPLLDLPAQGAHVAVKIELLGRLGAEHSVRFVANWLPGFGREASPAQTAAIVALGRLGAGERVAPYLDGALAAFRRAKGESPEGTPGHRSTWAAAFQAATALRDERFGVIGLEILGKRSLLSVLGELERILAECLSTLAPLELVPTVNTVLRADDAAASAQRVAVQIVELGSHRDQLEPMIALAGRAPTLATPIARALRGMLGAEDAGLARAFFECANPDDAAAAGLLARCEEILPADDQRAVAALLLERGVGGPKTQRRALALLGEGDAEAFLKVCVGLLASPHGDVVTAALRAGIAAGLLDRAEAYAPELLARARATLEGSAREGSAERDQLRLLVNATIPRNGIPGALDADAAGELRARANRIGHWTELPTFLSFHRELTDLALGGADLGLLHGAVLGLLATRTFFHPLTGKKGPYPGPLPRFDDVFASPSSFVQEGLFDTVCGAGYLCTERVLLRFLGSPRATVRARVLAKLKRETFLNYARDVLVCVEDTDAGVRFALVQALNHHELARFGERIRSLLDDGDERVCLAAARTLGAWGDVSCLARMVEFLSSDEASIRREAAHALRRLEPELLKGRLAARIGQADPQGTAAALLALSTERLPDDDPLAAAIFELAAKGRGPLRGLALHFLPVLAEPKRLAEVVPLLTDAQPRVREAAAFVLARQDGRRHAAAIAELATRTSDPLLRREILGLLSELGVPEAARGLVPLLLAEDPEVRAAVRRAVGATRGFSVQPELEKALADGLESKASADALRELIELLHRDGDEQAFGAIATALRCEDRAVWEAIVAAARDRGAEHATQHFPKLLELLGTEPQLPSALMTLALAESERDTAGRERLQKRARHIARSESSVDSVKRRALLAAFHCSKDEAELASELLKATAAQVKALEKQQPKKKTDVRAELTRAAGTLTTSARIGAASRADVADGLASVPREALRGALPWRLLDVGIEAALADGSGDVPKGLLKALSPLPPEGSSTAATRLARVARDRLDPEAFLSLCDSVKPEDTPDLLRSRLIAELRTGALDADALPKRLKGVAEDRWHAITRLMLASMEHWKPALRSQFGVLISELARRKIDLQPKSWQGRRQAEALYALLVGAKLRLGVREGSATLHTLRPDGRLELMSAEDDVAGLQTLVQEFQDPTKPLRRLGEIGGAAGAAALSAHVELSAPVYRREVAKALGATGAPAPSQAALSKLLSDTDTNVVAAALNAVAALGNQAHESAVLHWLGSEEFDVFSAACAAAAALELESARPLLRAALIGGERKRREPALKALHVLADAELLPDLVEIGRDLKHTNECDPLVPAIQKALGESPTDAQMNLVGTLLGEASPHAQEVAAHVFADAHYRKAIPALRALVANGAMGVIARAYACDGLREMQDAESYAAIRKAITRGDGADASVSISNLLGDMQLEGIMLLVATCPEGEREFVRGLLHEQLDAGNDLHAGFAAVGLQSLPSTPGTVKRLMAKLSPSVQGGFDGSASLARGMRALAALDPQAGSRIAIELWEALMAGQRNEAVLQAHEAWLGTDAGKTELDAWVGRFAQFLELPPTYRTRSLRKRLVTMLFVLSPKHTAPVLLRGIAGKAETAELLFAKLCEREDPRPEWLALLRGQLLSARAESRAAARVALAKHEESVSDGSAYERVIELAKADDSTCAVAASALVRAPGGEELSGELFVDLYRLKTPAARAALFANLKTLDDCVWPGFKRVFKLNERDRDPQLFGLQAFVLDQVGSWRKPSFRTLNYMRRRSYRLLKAIGAENPERFLETVRQLLLRFATIGRRNSELLARLLREVPEAGGHDASFAAKLANPFVADSKTGGVPDLIDLSDEALLESAPPPEPPAASTEARPRTKAWKGPLHEALWTKDPRALVELLGAAEHDDKVLRVILGLLRERVGDRVLAVELEVFYGLLEHPSLSVSRYALGQIAARARKELVRFGLLVPLFARMVTPKEPDWDALADLLWVLDDERADADRAGMAEPLLALISARPDDAGVIPVVSFFRRHMREALAPPLVGWDLALRLASGERPEVRELGRDAVRTLNASVVLEPKHLGALLTATPLIATAPDLVHEVLTRSPANPGGYRPPEFLAISSCVQAARSLGEVGFGALRRAFLTFEEQGGLDPSVALGFLGGTRSTRRGRALGMELYSSALARGAVSRVDMTVFLLGDYSEDVVVWASEHLERAATEGTLPNEGVYRLLDATGQVVNSFARDLVQGHLRQFDAAELIVFCAESPDASTSDLGIKLYERELKDRGYDLATLLPMFRILLYKVASARAEKVRLLGTLRRWALESAENARLVADVIAAFRRSEAKLDFSSAMTLLVLLGERFPEVELPFATATTFGYQR